MTTMDPVIPRGDYHIHYHHHFHHIEPILSPPQISNSFIRSSHGDLSTSHSDVVFPLPKVVRVHPIQSFESIPDIRRKTDDLFNHFYSERITRSTVEAYSQPSSPSFCLKGSSGSADAMTFAGFEKSSSADQRTLPLCYKRQQDGRMKSGHAETNNVVSYAFKDSPMKNVIRKNSAKAPNSNSSVSIAKGGYDLEFLPAPDTKFICPICILVMRHPYQTKCGHHFCQSCITQWLRRSDVLHDCPTCKETLSEDQMYKDAYMKREILNLVVKCPRYKEGCLSVVDLNHLGEHLTIDCAFKFNHDGVQHNKTTPVPQFESKFLKNLDKEVEEFLYKASSSPLTPPQSSTNLPRSSSSSLTPASSTTDKKSSAPKTTHNIIKDLPLVATSTALMTSPTSIWPSESLASFLPSSLSSSSLKSLPSHFLTSSSSYFSYPHMSTLSHSSLFLSLPMQSSSSSFLPPSIMADDQEQDV